MCMCLWHVFKVQLFKNDWIASNYYEKNLVNKTKSFVAPSNSIYGSYVPVYNMGKECFMFHK
jgi:hypothetical protein